MEDKLYCDIIDVENYTLTETADYFEPQITKWINSASIFMDNLANRVLVAPAIGSGEDMEVKYYDGNSRNSLMVDDIREIETVKIGNKFGENLIETLDYITFPRVAPYNKIILKESCFTKGTQNVEITGRFGYFDEIPADIRFACAVLVAGIINAQNKDNSTKKSESIGNYSVTYIDEKGLADFYKALDIIEKYKKITF